MSEVGIAFPRDEASAQVIASRLRAAGIAARVDRGLAISWQVPAVDQLTVFVDERDAKRAARIVGAAPARPVTSISALRAGVALLIVALMLGFAALVQLLTR